MSTLLDLSAGVDICTDAVALATSLGATDAEVSHGVSERFEVNHETSEIGLIRTTLSDTVSVTVYVDGAKGSSTVGGRSRDDVARAVHDALEAARADRPDPGNVVAPGEPTGLVEVGDREPDRDAMVSAVIDLMERLGLEYPMIRYGDSSAYSWLNGWSSFASSAGVTRQERRSGYVVQGLFTGKDGVRTTSMNYSGCASVTPFDDLLESATFRRLLDETMASFDPTPVPETFVGDVLFTPASVQTMVGPVVGSLGGMALLQGTSVYADALGTMIASPALTLTSRPVTGDFPMINGFDAHGILATDLDVVVDGEIRDHLIGWYPSKKLDRPMTAGVTALGIAPGGASYGDLIAQMERGIVLGRFSGGAPSVNLDFSGVAKNSFYVEDGRIVGPISETMVAGSFQELLRNVRAVGDEVVRDGTSAYPYVLTSGATISTR